MTSVTLTTEQYLRAGLVGYNRHRTAKTHELKVRFRRPTWQEEIDGAGAELAVSIATGLAWTGEHWLWSRTDRIAPPDVGECSEVKWTLNSHNPKLRFHPGWDNEDYFYFLVNGTAPTYTILGWLKGTEALALGVEKVYPERTIIEVAAEKLHPIRTAVAA